MLAADTRVKLRIFSQCELSASSVKLLASDIFNANFI